MGRVIKDVRVGHSNAQLEGTQEIALEHEDMPAATSPCVHGFRMFSYHDWMMDSKWIELLKKAFIEIDPEENIPFNACPDTMNHDTISAFLVMVD